VFDLITGLPVHPLISHAVVVVVPLAAFGALILTFVAKWRNTYSPLVLIAVLLSPISAFIATQSGEALSERVGLPKSHSTLGERLSYVVLAFAIVFSIWFAIERSAQVRTKVPKILQQVVKVIVPILAIASLTLTVLVGHSGAEASWKYRIAQTQLPALEDSAPNASAPAGMINLSTSEIKMHNSKSDCWSIVNANVYNLTSYVQKHPGGNAVIANICGKDGTSSFANQHNTQSKPNSVLTSFLLGSVGASITTDVANKVVTPPASSSNDESGEESDED
jgi:cytochrome b involved in lipid metabolism